MIGLVTRIAKETATRWLCHELLKYAYSHGVKSYRANHTEYKRNKENMLPMNFGNMLIHMGQSHIGIVIKSARETMTRCSQMNVGNMYTHMG